jgi:hypothetical protein
MGQVEALGQHHRSIGANREPFRDASEQDLSAQLEANPHRGGGLGLFAGGRDRQRQQFISDQNDPFHTVKVGQILHQPLPHRFTENGDGASL